jgi:TRAP-type C4-dicarboxylate transport system permease small subunit
MELTEAVFCILCFFSFAFAWIKGDHIRVGIFIERAPRGVQKLVILASALIGIFVFGCLVYSGLQLTWFSLTRGDTTANLHLPRALPQSAMVVGALVLCLQIIAALPAEFRRIDKAHEKEDAL